MYSLIIFFVAFVNYFDLSLQDCPEEISNNGILVKWHETKPAINVKSDPVCYKHDNIVTRNCTHSGWSPPLEELEMCLKVVEHFDISSCPPGFHKILETNNLYCYEINAPSVWNKPCLESGGASVITDLSSEETESLLNSLLKSNISRYFWLPAKRESIFQPMRWFIPSKNWARSVNFSDTILSSGTPNFRNCLLLDIQKRSLVAERCTKKYPSLCLYINNMEYTAICPKGYYAFRFVSDKGICAGIEKADDNTGLTYFDFLINKCKKPLGEGKENDLKMFIFNKIASKDNLPNDISCWFTKRTNIDIDDYNSTDEIWRHTSLEGVINNAGALTLMNTSSKLPCMACETSVIYVDTEVLLEYKEELQKIYLTVYFPSGLWKYQDNEIGIQCFSNAQGFFNVIEVNDFPIIEINARDSLNIGEKIVYVINLVTDMSAQYWCEGHTKNLTLITTEKIIVNPQGSQVHVFSLHIRININLLQIPFNITRLKNNINEIFNAKNTLIMTLNNDTPTEILVILHLHIAINATNEDNVEVLLKTHSDLETKAMNELPKYNYTFHYIASSTHCLPTTSVDYIKLHWPLTPIGHFATPIQFCLQANGLPVKRLCYGSYLLGSTWGEVEGYCNRDYMPSSTTTFLYKFVKEQIPENMISSFLTDGLNFVLRDTDIMIPADIYYLSQSLQLINEVAQNNLTMINMGDIENIAWIMDRVMDINGGLLHLAQTLNSSNVLLDSIKNIVEIITQHNAISHRKKDPYVLAVKNQFVIQVSYPELNNISGLAIFRTGLSNNFTNMSVKPLFKNMTIDDIFTMEDLEIATWLPDNLLKSLKVINDDSIDNLTDDMHIVLSVYHNNAIFQELHLNRHVINSRIIEITVPGFLSNLEYPVPLIFRELNVSNHSKHCGFWNFERSKIGNIPGFWAEQGCFMIKSWKNLTFCECFHLTHFGQLINIEKYSIDDQNIINKKHSDVLNIITLIGSFLSLLGIIGIWVTALVFDVWRKKAGTKVLLQLSTSIAMPLILMIVFNLDHQIFIEQNGKHIVDRKMRIVCVTLGALLHYSILANFIWMLITATLQFIRYVRVLGVSRPSRFMVKFTILGWGTPLIPVIIILATDYQNYIPNPSISHPICYPNGFHFIFAIVVPICLVLFVNIILFVLVIKAISQSPDMRITDKTLIWAQLRLSILLFFLLGLTWIFGIVSFTKNVIWSYLFCLTSTVQGFVLFVYFVICDPATRKLWITIMTPEFLKSASSKSITSISNES